MSLVHYVDTDEWNVACAEPSDRLVPPDRAWTFVADRVTCPECLRVIQAKRAFAEAARGERSAP